jgi:hypothetical protein
MSDGIKLAVLEWLDGADMGEVITRHHENPWMVISLMDAQARLARACWQRGDEDGTRQHLAACPGLPGWFVQ